MKAQITRRRMLGIALGAAAAPPGSGRRAPEAPTAAPAKTDAKPADAGKPAEATKPAADSKPAAAAPAAGAKAEEIVFWPRSPSESQVVWEKITPVAKKLFPELTVNLQAP